MTLPERYNQFTQWIERLTGQPDDLLHIHAGMAVFMVARLVTGRSFGSFIPFAFAVAAELVNELLDYLHGQGWTASGSAVDLVNTLFWPAVISAGVRWRPMIRRDRPAPDRPGIDDAA